MRYKLIIRPEAELDLLEAVKWYEEKIKGLGANFLLNVEATIGSILRMPEAYTTAYINTRRALVRKFPFGIHYLIEKEIILMLLVYPKNEQDNLTAVQLKILKSLVEKELQ